MQACTCIALPAVVESACKYLLESEGRPVSGSAELRTFSLSKPLSPEMLHALRGEVARAVAAGARAVAVDIDDVGILDSAVISILIEILRDARESGATVALRAERKSILETLRITALDKVFTIEARGAGASAAPPLRRTRIPGRRFVAGLVGLLFGLVALFGSRASAAPELSPGDMVGNIVAKNAAMHSYEAQVDVALHLRSFPYAAQHLAGTTYFKRPDNFEVVFDRVPSYAAGFEKVYSDIDDPTSWPRRFEMSFAGERNMNGHRDVVVRLVQKVRGMIDHEDVAVDPAQWRIDAMEWHYYNGGVIAMSQEYQNVGGFDVLSKQHATIRIPFVHAAADATYSQYRTNVAIDDSIFTRDKR